MRDGGGCAGRCGGRKPSDVEEPEGHAHEHDDEPIASAGTRGGSPRATPVPGRELSPIELAEDHGCGDPGEPDEHVDAAICASGGCCGSGSCGGEPQDPHAPKDPCCGGHGHEEAHSVELPESFEDGLERTCLSVNELCCETEAGLARRTLGRIEGVRSVVVYLLTREVRVVHTPGVEAEVLAAQLGSSGLSAHVVQDGEPSGEMGGRWPWFGLGLGLLFALSLFSGQVEALRWAAGLAALVGLWPIARKAWGSLRLRVVDMNGLMVVAVLGALAIGEWHEGAAVVFLFALSAFLESRAMSRAGQALRRVAALVPQRATLADGRVVSCESVQLGQTIVIKAGERVPLDGRVSLGQSSVDESTLTGESVPVSKRIGDEVSAGTLNQGGYLEVEVTELAGDSAAARLLRLVDEARGRRSPTERSIDRFAKVYTPVVVMGALFVALVPPLFGGEWSVWFYRSLVLLVVACPCALVIATPVAVVSAMARAARMGVLIKGGGALEVLGRVKAIAFDKTGTLTRGHLNVEDCHAFPPYTNEQAHQMLVLAEGASSHPLAAALLQHVDADQPASVALLETRSRAQWADDANYEFSYRTIEGQGIEVFDGERTLSVGNHRMAVSRGWHGEREHELFERLEAQGKTVVYLGAGPDLVAVHALWDSLRPEAAPAIAALRAMGLSTHMLTGDNAGAAARVQAQVELDEVLSELLPADKVSAVSALRAWAWTAMVGDGINDAPALAGAHVGIAMGARGSALAVESADVALMSDDLRGVPKVLALGRRTLRVIWTNITFALLTKSVVLLLAVAGLATLWMAVAVDVGTTLLVVLYSLTLLRGGGVSQDPGFPALAPQTTRAGSS